jgi:hypothetical protein
LVSKQQHKHDQADDKQDQYQRDVGLCLCPHLTFSFDDSAQICWHDQLSPTDPTSDRGQSCDPGHSALRCDPGHSALLIRYSYIAALGQMIDGGH